MSKKFEADENDYRLKPAAVSMRTVRSNPQEGAFEIRPVGERRHGDVGKTQIADELPRVCREALEKSFGGNSIQRQNAPKRRGRAV